MSVQPDFGVIRANRWRFKCVYETDVGSALTHPVVAPAAAAMFCSVSLNKYSTSN